MAKWWTSSLVSFLLVICCCQCVSADTIQFDFSGTVTSSDLLAHHIAYGDPFSGEFSYDPNEAPFSGSASYPVDSFEVTAGGVTYSSSSATAGVQVFSDMSNFYLRGNFATNDYMIIDLFGSGLLAGPFDCSNPLSDASLPTSFTFTGCHRWIKSSNDFLLVAGDPNTNSFAMDGDIDTIQRVPEPSTFVLFAVGVVLLFMFNLFHNRASSTASSSIRKV